MADCPSFPAPLNMPMFTKRVFYDPDVSFIYKGKAATERRGDVGVQVGSAGDTDTPDLSNLELAGDVDGEGTPAGAVVAGLSALLPSLVLLVPAVGLHLSCSALNPAYPAHPE